MQFVREKNVKEKTKIDIFGHGENRGKIRNCSQHRVGRCCKDPECRQQKEEKYQLNDIKHLNRKKEDRRTRDSDPDILSQVLRHTSFLGGLNENRFQPVVRKPHNTWPLYS